MLLSGIKAVIALILGALTLAGLAGGIYYFVTGPRRAHVEAVQATAASIQSQATTASAQDALKITVDNQAAHSRIDVVTHEATDEIRNVPGASAAVAPAVHSAGLRALCLYDAYRLQPACKQLLDADPQHPSD